MSRSEKTLDRIQRLERIAEGSASHLDVLRGRFTVTASHGLAFFAMASLSRRLGAVCTLLRNDLSLECDALLRGLSESALNLAWAHESEAKATRVLASGPLDALQLLQRAHAEGYPISEERIADLVTSTAETTGMPSLFERVAETTHYRDGVLALFDDEPLTRQQAAVHHDSAYMKLVVEYVDVTDEVLLDSYTAALLIVDGVASAMDDDDVLAGIRAELSHLLAGYAED